MTRVQCFRPFEAAAQVVFARAAARSPEFDPNPAAGDMTVLIGSAAGLSEDEVAVRARSELRERASNVLAGRAAEDRHECVATYDQLCADGRTAVDPAALGGAEDLRAQPMLWVVGEGLIGAEPVLVPAGAAFLQHRPPAGCGRAPGGGSAGISAHRSREDAVRHALLEVLERDLFWRAWYGTGTALAAMAPEVQPGSELGAALAALDLECVGLLAAGPGGTGCAIACLHCGGGAQSFGARALVDGGVAARTAALESAVCEALMVRWSVDTPAGQRAWRLMGERDEPGPPRNPLERALWAFHSQDGLAHLLARVQPRASAPPPVDPGSLAALLAAHTGEEPVALDTTVPAVCGDGEVVIRVVAPGAHRLPGDERTHPARGAAPPHPLA